MNIKTIIAATLIATMSYTPTYASDNVKVKTYYSESGWTADRLSFDTGENACIVNGSYDNGMELSIVFGSDNSINLVYSNKGIYYNPDYSEQATLNIFDANNNFVYRNDQVITSASESRGIRIGTPIDLEVITAIHKGHKLVITTPTIKTTLNLNHQELNNAIDAVLNKCIKTLK